MTLARYAGYEDGSAPAETTEELIEQHHADRLSQLEDENADLHRQVRALQSALGVAAKVLQPYWAPAKLARQR